MVGGGDDEWNIVRSCWPEHLVTTAAAAAEPTCSRRRWSLDGAADGLHVVHARALVRLLISDKIGAGIGARRRRLDHDPPRATCTADRPDPAGPRQDPAPVGAARPAQRSAAQPVSRRSHCRYCPPGFGRIRTEATAARRGTVPLTDGRSSVFGESLHP